MIIKFALFLVFSLLLLFGMHYVFFKSIIYFFQIERPPVKIAIYTAMVLLTFVFITAFVLLHWRENIWTISYYKFAATWMGFLIHSLVAVAAAWIVIGLFRLIGWPVPTLVVAVALLLSAAAGSGYGLWSAFHPIVRNVVVPVDHLPKAWKESTIIQLSDIHLGHIHRKKFAHRIVASVNALDPDLVLVTGDLLDGMGGPFADNLKPFDDLQAKKGKFIITGNHEHYVGIRRAMRIIKTTPFRILDNEAVEIDGLEIVGVSYPGIKSTAQIDNFSIAKKSGNARILLFHTPTEMGIGTGSIEAQHFSNYWMPDTTYDMNKMIGADVQLSGHTHKGQVFPFNLVTRLLYGGRDYGLTTDGDFQMYTTCGTGSWGPPMRTVGRPEIVRIRLVQKTEAYVGGEGAHSTAAQGMPG